MYTCLLISLRARKIHCKRNGTRLSVIKCVTNVLAKKNYTHTSVILIPVVSDMLQAQIYVPRNAHLDTTGGENFDVAIFFFNLYPQYKRLENNINIVYI